ncbi:MAG: BolA family transcriptional regulator [Devosiaceae bacterium]|nr:BolA family transcriptional regulator [Devosiaceae bacterium]
MGILQNIEKKLTNAFSPDFLRVIDESEKHRGHANWIEGKSTHFRVEISADQLKGMSRVAQHRAITNVLKQEFEGELHALVIKVVKSPVR